MLAEPSHKLASWALVWSWLLSSPSRCWVRLEPNTHRQPVHTYMWFRSEISQGPIGALRASRLLRAADLLTSTRAPLVTSSAGADSSDRSMRDSSLLIHGWQHIHLLKLDTKASGYCTHAHFNLENLSIACIGLQQKGNLWGKQTCSWR